MEVQTIELLSKRIKEQIQLNNLDQDSFLRKCLVCYSTWRSGFKCTTKDCSQHGWCIDYNDFEKEEDSV